MLSVSKMEEGKKSIKAVEMNSEKGNLKEKAAEAMYRISSFMLTKAWLKSRQESSELTEKLELHSIECQKAEQVFESKKSQYFEEQKENEELTCQLRLTQKEVEKLNHSFDELASTISKLEGKKKELLVQFNMRCDECIDTNMQISDLKLKLMENLERNQQLEIGIENEISEAEKLNKQTDSLNDELNNIKAEYEENEHKLQKEIDDIDNEIKRIKSEKTILKTKISELKSFTEEYENMKSNDRNSDAAIEMEKTLLYLEAAALRGTLDQSFENKFRKYGNKVVSIAVKGLLIILPALPTEIVLSTKAF